MSKIQYLHHVNHLLCLFFLLASFSACFEPKKGCLDISATNFDVGADEDCCCEYPKLVLTVDQVYDTLLFRNDSLYPDANGHLFRIKSIACYLSDFQLVQNSQPFTMSDVLSCQILSGFDTIAQDFTNDFLLVRRAPLSHVVGTFQQDGIFSEVRLRLGLSADAQKILPSKLASTHPLSPQPDSLWRGNSAGFVFLQAVVVRDSMLSTLPDTLRFMEADLGQYFITGTGAFSHATGYDFPLTLKADYKKLFEGVNWTTHDIMAWKTQIIANLPHTFSVSQ